MPLKVMHMPSLKSLHPPVPPPPAWPGDAGAELASVLLHLLGESIVNARGEPLGTIDDLLVDPSSGRVTYAVMAWGGFMGRGERQLVLPWNCLRRDGQHHAFVIEADKERLDSAPSIDANRGPAGRSLEWHRAVHRHYGVPAPA